MAPPLLSLSNWPSSKGGQYEHEYRLPLRAYHILAQTGRGFSLPVDCALGPEGVLYVLNRGTPTQRNTHVTICTVDGEYRTDFGSYGAGDGQFIWPTAIVVDREGVSTSALRANTASRSLARRAYQQGTPGGGDGELDGPASMVFDRDENLYGGSPTAASRSSPKRANFCSMGRQRRG